MKLQRKVHIITRENKWAEDMKHITFYFILLNTYKNYNFFSIFSVYLTLYIFDPFVISISLRSLRLLLFI